MKAYYTNSFLVWKSQESTIGTSIIQLGSLSNPSTVGPTSYHTDKQTFITIPQIQTLRMLSYALLGSSNYHRQFY